MYIKPRLCVKPKPQRLYIYSSGIWRNSLQFSSAPAKKIEAKDITLADITPEKHESNKTICFTGASAAFQMNHKAAIKHTTCVHNNVIVQEGIVATYARSRSAKTFLSPLTTGIALGAALVWRRVKD
mmetsp:Transcript_120670/g.188373  ORF Transcript_120670/g.188373 Transcript_120670/m.188373 type:complete len:127 (-) Transcript_120670:106-486(-)